MKKGFWYSRSAILILLLLAVFLGYQKISQYRLQSSIEKEKLALQKQIAELEKNNTDLEQTLNFLNSEEYKELIARQQLNMQKSGEQTYNFSAKNNLATDANSDTKPQSNFQKWLSYFLNQNPSHANN